MSSYTSLRYLCVLFVICRVNLAHCENVQEHDKGKNILFRFNFQIIFSFLIHATHLIGILLCLEYCGLQ